MALGSLLSMSVIKLLRLLTNDATYFATEEFDSIQPNSQSPIHDVFHTKRDIGNTILNT